MKHISAIMIFLFMMSAIPIHAKGVNGCVLFDKSFPGGTAFTTRTWALPTAGGGARLVSDPTQVVKLELSRQKVRIEKDKTTQQPTKLVLLETGDEVAIVGGNVHSVVGKTFTLGKALPLDAAVLKKEQRESLRRSVKFADWLEAVEDKSGALYQVPLKDNRANQRTVFDGALSDIRIRQGEKLKIKSTKPAGDNPSEVTLEAADGVNLDFADLSNLGFTFDFPVSLKMVAPDLATGSLDVIGSKRSIQGTALTLALTLGSVDFGATSFRGCIGFEDQRLAKDGDIPAEPEILWLPIDNVSVTNPTAGRAQVSFHIKDLPACLDNAPSCADTDADPYTPRTDKTFKELLYGGQENVRIKLFAATSDNGILYSGSTAYFIDDRNVALLISLAAFVLGYILVFVFRKRRGAKEKQQPLTKGDLSPLQLVRGHDGTASLSNLQILWWTLAVFSLMIYSWVATGDLAGLNHTVMWLLGIGGTGSLAAKAVAINNEKNNAAVAAMREENSDVQPSGWDLISVNGRLDLTKLQMLLFTIVAGIYVVTNVWEQVVFPVLPPELLTLMGLSNGLYVLGKVTASNPYQEVGNLLQEEKIVEGQLSNLTAEKEVLAKKIKELEQGKTKTQLAAIKDELDTLKKRLTDVDVELQKQNARKTKLDAEVAAAKAKIKEEEKSVG
jgi:hypothetical protein